MSSPKIFEKYTFKETENEVTDLLNVITIVFSLPAIVPNLQVGA